MLQADVVLDCGATEAAGGVEAVQILVDAATQGFVILASMWTLWTDHGFVLLMVTGAGLSLKRVWLLTPMGWISIYTLEAKKTCQFLPV